MIRCRFCKKGVEVGSDVNTSWDVLRAHVEDAHPVEFYALQVKLDEHTLMRVPCEV